ncbi:ATP-binding protein [Microbispora sp. H11081]|uniref:sensor histidine kinase n=1 Tax=Microbispora sp. H11081 TaxID=2729107 RepID=UPI0014734DCD|nr:sensor histidine kinase [Microbispora sp. H11081]
MPDSQEPDGAAPPPLPPLASAGRTARLPVSRWFLLAGTGVLVIFLIALSAILLALSTTYDARRTLVDAVDPAALETLRIARAVQTQEGAIRGYGLTGEQQYLDTYRQGVAEERSANDALAALLPHLPQGYGVRDQIRELAEATDAWRRDYAEPVVTRTRTSGPGPLTDLARHNLERFSAVRVALDKQQAVLGKLHDVARDRLYSGWNTIYWAVAALFGAMVLAIAFCALIVRRAVVRPIATLTRQVRAVAAGDFDHELGVDRPAELWELSGHIDGMRRRIMSEWRSSVEARQQLAEQAEELKRSNRELEQFAYVASHDLQEPLRKVASFTQMLEQRYSDRLDDRARQYIGFAVDGARRMQLLINDLLDFSRVGRVGAERVEMDTGDALAAALRNLDSRLSDTGATVTHDDMPKTVGNSTLLTQLFQNLISNGLKFRSDEPPLIHIGVRRDGDMWEFSCADNGIGVEPKYADRIFLIFQRLHPRDVYPGTGIGLALCRKIVEYHGGRIWLDTNESAGATFRWTLPALGDPDD